ncbi:MAG: ribonucleoside triphosphate reductase [Candidatus Diapherotrites archaeon]|nr:ribonucleoside triphosphate reductase [Candidatus Diapherotrites archaeon]
MPEKIRKRDGSVVKFDQRRITKAIERAIKAIGKKDGKLAKKLSDRVVKKLGKVKITTVERVQDVVEEVLVEYGNVKLVRAYIRYRYQHEKLRKTKSLFEETDKIIDSYLKQKDWRVRENSNITYSFAGLVMYVSNAAIANYTLDRIYPAEISKAHKSGDIHIHDLQFGLTGYCAGWSLKQLLLDGFGGVPGRTSSKPAKHFDTALLQMVNFLGTLQNEWAGAMAFSSVDTYLAPFVAKDKLSYKQVLQGMQKFIFNLNITSRWGGQTLFTNVTFDWKAPEDLREEHIIIGGKQLRQTYGEFQDEMDMINKAFIEIMMQGDANGRPFTFPIPTYNITKEFDWNSENADLLFEMTAKYGLPYFSNFVNSDLDPKDIRSMCCHLRLDLRQLERNITGGLFGSAELTGSVGVVTINMPRIGYLSKDEVEFFERLDKLMEIAKNSLEIKRKVVARNMENGLLPYSKRYLGSLANHFSTIGLVGMNEACLNLFGKDISTKKGKAFAERTLKHMLERLKDFQEETGNLYNLEATPAEGSSYRLAYLDKKKYPKIITASKEVPRYTNSTWLPVDKTDDVIYALKHQEALQTLYTGGTVFHAFFGERLNSGKACKRFVKKVMYKTRIPYLTVTPTFSICQEHGYIVGEEKTCPICGKETEVYSRVVGYFRPVKDWNPGKQQEFKERKTYNPKKA